MQNLLPWAKKQFSSPAIGHISNWAGVIGALGTVWATMTWAASGFSAIAQQGWGAVVFAGVGLTCLIAFASRALLPVAVYFWPPPPRPPATAIQRQEATRQELSDINSSIQQLDRDAILLLNFAVDQTTFHLLQTVIASLPINNNLSLEADNDARARKMHDIETAIRQAYLAFSNSNRGVDMDNILHHAQWKAEQFVKNTTVPPHLDQIDYLKCEVLELKVLDLKWYLMHELAKKREELAQHRNRLAQRSRTRNDPS
jgi:hypothetical protein